MPTPNTTSPNGSDTDTRTHARLAYLASVAAGDPMSGRTLGDRFDRSASWGRSVAAEARAASNGNGHQAATPAGASAPAPAPSGASDRQAHASTPPSSDPGAPGAPAERQARRWFDAGVTLAVAVVAALASYGHMYDVALLAGEPVWIARAWPITVDGLAIAALRSGERGRWWLLLALAVSVASNVLAQYPTTVADIAPGVSAWPPVALLGTHRLLARRHV